MKGSVLHLVVIQASAGRNAALLRTSRVDLTVADICGRIRVRNASGPKSRVAREVEQGVCEMRNNNGSRIH